MNPDGSAYLGKLGELRRRASAPHDWRCWAPEGGFYRWECRRCHATAPYPSDGSMDTPCTASVDFDRLTAAHTP